MNFVVGLDLGQSADFTALAILERLPAERVWAVRNLVRFALGTPYTEIVERVRLLMNSWPLRGDSHLVVDGTGVGRPVLDLLRRPGLGARLVSVTIHGGDHVTRDPVVHGYRVPKRELISCLQLLFQQHRLKVAATLPEAKAFLTELSSFRIRISEGGHDSYAAGKSTEHDDLVLAVGLAVWLGQRYSPLPMGPPEPAPAALGGKVAEFFEALRAEERGRNPDFIAMGGYQPGLASGFPGTIETRPGVLGRIAHAIRTGR